jgi:serine/threonine protein kinase
MEYASEGELFNYIVKKRRLDESEASFFFVQIINGLEYIHKNNITHRDLKPENLLINKDNVLKIIDFGLSNVNSNLLATPCGSPCYAAPEMILGKKYSGKCVDIWSTGIILYAMVCGYLPFEDPDNNKLYKKILQCNLTFPDFVSKNCVDLITKILNVNPVRRYKLEEIKKHEFFKIGEKRLHSHVAIDLRNNVSIDLMKSINININCTTGVENININIDRVDTNISNNKKNLSLDINTTDVRRITSPDVKKLYSIKNDIKVRKVDLSVGKPKGVISSMKSSNIQNIINDFQKRRKKIATMVDKKER